MSGALDYFVVRSRTWQGLAPCCGATNASCALPPGVVIDSATGCEKCGHPKSCHAKTWAG